jgi:curved DNA-binding protein
MGLTEETVRQTINLTPFSDVFVLEGQGHRLVSGERSNLIIEINTPTAGKFSIKGLNISTFLNISPAQAILGDTVEIPVFNRKVPVRIPSGVQHGQTLVEENGGIIFKNRSGTLKVRLNIVIPQIISQEEEALYRRLSQLEKESEKWPKILTL